MDSHTFLRCWWCWSVRRGDFSPCGQANFARFIHVIRLDFFWRSLMRRVRLLVLFTLSHIILFSFTQRQNIHRNEAKNSTGTEGKTVKFQSMTISWHLVSVVVVLPFRTFAVVIVVCHGIVVPCWSMARWSSCRGETSFFHLGTRRKDYLYAWQSEFQRNSLTSLSIWSPIGVAWTPEIFRRILPSAQISPFSLNDLQNRRNSHEFRGDPRTKLVTLHETKNASAFYAFPVATSGNSQPIAFCLRTDSSVRWQHPPSHTCTRYRYTRHTNCLQNG